MSEPTDYDPKIDGGEKPAEMAANGVDAGSVREKKETSRKHRRRAGGCLLAASVIVSFLLIATGLVWFAASEARKIPEPYAAVLDFDPEMAATHGSRLERNLLRLQNAARTRNPWRVELTQQQINGWIVSDLPEKFPHALPSQIRDPRVVIEKNELKVIFKLVSRHLTGFVVVTAEIFSTDVQNEVAVKIIDARSGFVRLPIAPWVDQVSDVMRSLGVPLDWVNEHDSPVAVFTIPQFMTPDGAPQYAAIDSISLQKGKLLIAGQSKTAGKQVAKSKEETPQRK